MLFGFSREVPTRNHTNRIFHTNIQCSAERGSLFYAHCIITFYASSGKTEKYAYNSHV